VLTERIFATYTVFDSSANLPELCWRLYDQQKRSWPMLADGCASLSDIRTRAVQCSAYSVMLQFNPRRIASTNASVDDASIRARKCFLCADNLPAEQKGILYKDALVILCNPSPIFKGHFTVSGIEHRPQEIRPALDVFIGLSRDLSPSFTVFYNGPKCGASAPDHLHFQAVPSGSIPVEHESQRPERRTMVTNVSGTTIMLLAGLGREAVVLEGNDPSMLVELTHRLLDALESTGNNAEPMVNILSTYAKGIWRILIFARRKHRPSVFFLEADAGRILVSPAAVDMGGLMITPLEKDFLAITPDLVEQIYSEVSLGREAVVEALRQIA
jgi:hypothetical protein